MISEAVGSGLCHTFCNKCSFTGLRGLSEMMSANGISTSVGTIRTCAVEGLGTGGEGMVSGGGKRIPPMEKMGANKYKSSVFVCLHSYLRLSRACQLLST
jgi:hypothetical protein